MMTLANIILQAAIHEVVPSVSVVNNINQRALEQLLHIKQSSLL